MLVKTELCIMCWNGPTFDGPVSDVPNKATGALDATRRFFADRAACGLEKIRCDFTLLYFLHSYPVLCFCMRA